MNLKFSGSDKFYGNLDKKRSLVKQKRKLTTKTSKLRIRNVFFKYRPLERQPIERNIAKALLG